MSVYSSNQRNSIWRRIQELREVSDASGLQQNFALLESDSIKHFESRRSQWQSQSQLFNATLIQSHRPDAMKQLEPNSVSLNESSLSEEFSFFELKQTNQKLFNDNKTLLQQCIRLTKLIKQKESVQKRNQFLVWELERAKNQILLTKNYTNELEQKLKGQISMREKEQQYRDTIKQLEKQKVNLLNKVEGLERTKIFSTCSSQHIRDNSRTSPSSPNHSILDARRNSSEKDRDRIINNLKLVHETERKKMTSKILEQGSEIAKLKQHLQRVKF